MKKIFLIASAAVCSFFMKAQQIDFQFQILNASGTTSYTTTPVTSYQYVFPHNAPVQQVNVDLSASVCEGDVIQLKNLTSGTWGTQTIDGTKQWDAAWGYWYRGAIPAANVFPYYWNVNTGQNVFHHQLWYNSSKTIQIPTNTVTYPSIIISSGNPGTYTLPSPSPYMLMGSVNPNDPAYAYKWLLITPRLNDGFVHLDEGGNYTSCTRVYVLRLKVKRAPAPLLDQTVCQGQTASIVPASGVTATNWTPSDPNTTPVNTTTNYSVTLSNGGCTYIDNVTVNIPGLPLAATITGPATICAGQLLTFTGNETSGQSYEAKWELIECTSTGTPIGSTLSSSAFNGSYIGASFTFPFTPTCGKYFKVKYIVNGYAEAPTMPEGYCMISTVVEKIVSVVCPPVADAGPDKTVCNGACVSIGTTLYGRNRIYSWLTNVGGTTTTIGTAPGITVCPTTTTTYTLIVTNTQTGCTASDVVTVFAAMNNPDFNRNTHAVTGQNYYTVDVNPIQTDGYTPANPGFGEVYSIVEVLEPTPGVYTDVAGTNTALGTPGNPSCWWWQYPNALNFPGFTGTANVTCSTPAIGQFTLGKKYRITRGTWNAYCPWNQIAYIVFNSGAQRTNGNPEITFVVDPNAPDLSALKSTESALTLENNLFSNNAIAFPNPTSGLVKIESKETIKTIRVTTITGALVAEKQNVDSIDLSDFPAGMYFFNVSTENSKKVIKVIKE